MSGFELNTDSSVDIDLDERKYERYPRLSECSMRNVYECMWNLYKCRKFIWIWSIVRKIVRHVTYTYVLFPCVYTTRSFFMWAFIYRIVLSSSLVQFLHLNNTFSLIDHFSYCSYIVPIYMTSTVSCTTTNVCLILHAFWYLFMIRQFAKECFVIVVSSCKWWKLWQRFCVGHMGSSTMLL